jgi:DNA adenine methylase
MTLKKSLSERNIYEQLAVKPFLRWAGGKSKLVGLLEKFMPEVGSYNCYFEPFFGAGALFFHTIPEKAVLSDLNEDLINCYQQVSKDPNGVWNLLEEYIANNSREFYYTIRSQQIEKITRVRRAARFIYLNKTAFNGIYRVNMKGEFNVPYGPSPNGPAFPSKICLESAGKALTRARLVASDFRNICSLAKPGDFVYLDPPYPPLNETSSFRHYTTERFSWDDQQEVANVFKRLDQKKCLVMLSNSDCDKVRSMYGKYQLHQLSVTRWLGANGNRFKVHEIVVTNFKPQLLLHKGIKQQ